MRIGILFKLIRGGGQLQVSFARDAILFTCCGKLWTLTDSDLQTSDFGLSNLRTQISNAESNLRFLLPYLARLLQFAQQQVGRGVIWINRQRPIQLRLGAPVKLQIKIQFRQHCAKDGVGRLQLNGSLNFILGQPARILVGSQRAAVVSTITRLLRLQSRGVGQILNGRPDASLL